MAVNMLPIVVATQPHGDMSLAPALWFLFCIINILMGALTGTMSRAAAICALSLPVFAIGGALLKLATGAAILAATPWLIAIAIAAVLLATFFVVAKDLKASGKNWRSLL